MYLKKGIYPTMVTPFDENNKVDYTSLKRFIQWLEVKGADGLFAVCQSSEMFNLTESEKYDIAKFVKSNTNLPVVASGHTQKDLYSQVEFMKKTQESGVDAVVLISNAFAQQNQSEDVFLSNLDKLLNKFNKDIPLGMYECPYPYKRLLSLRIIKYMLETKRFIFIKDTSCNRDILKERLELLNNTKLGLYNAHAQSLIYSLKLGANGYSGVHANVSPKLLKHIYDNYDNDLAYEEEILYMISDTLKDNIYPVSAKQYLKNMNIFDSINTRVKDHNGFNDRNIEKIKHMQQKVKEVEEKI